MGIVPRSSTAKVLAFICVSNIFTLLFLSETYGMLENWKQISFCIIRYNFRKVEPGQDFESKNESGNQDFHVEFANFEAAT